MLDVVAPAPAGQSAVPPPRVPEVPVRHAAVFNGRAGEYFGIWFVNLLLGIVTLGLYSAWAKVRTQRYFYANTTLAGSSFDYLASPWSILKGRLIAYALVIALGISARTAPGVYAALLFAVGLSMPALLVLSLRFRARNSAWRGLSFRFDNGMGEAYGPFMLWGWLSGLSLSLMYPAMKRRQHDFIVEGHRYGTRRFRFFGTTWQYFGPYAVAVGLFVALAIASAIGLPLLKDRGLSPDQAGAGIALAFAGFYLVAIGMLVMLRVRYANLMWNNTRLGEHRFESSLRVRDLAWIYASNLVAIVCTLGLAVPWAMVRLARYRAAHFALVARGSLDEFAAASERRHGAAGAELVDALDMGMDIGL